MSDPRREAEARLGGRYSARVLEPSPPAVDDGDYFADDPATRGASPDDGRPVVTPTGDGDVTWDELAGTDPDLATWAAARWLGPWRPLEPLPPAFAATRDALHRVGVYVVSPARSGVNGKIGLRFTRDGFGTPFFGRDRQVRVAGADLVVTEGGQDDVTAITTLAAAARTVGVDLGADPGVGHDVPPLGDVEADLAVDPAAAIALGALFGFAASVLEAFRWERRRAGADVERVQLWPEHFDLAFDDGWANYGVSPGDALHADPYLYVGPWDRAIVAADPFWNAPFGAVLSYRELSAADDQRAAALAFLRAGQAWHLG